MVSMYKFQSLSDEDLTSAVTSFCTMYKNDVSKEMVDEMMLLKKIRHANLGDVQMSPLQLLNKLHDLRLESLFPNVCGYFAPCQSPWHLQKKVLVN